MKALKSMLFAIMIAASMLIPTKAGRVVWMVCWNGCLEVAVIRTSKVGRTDKEDRADKGSRGKEPARPSMDNWYSCCSRGQVWA